MAIQSYNQRLRDNIERWRREGLIDARTQGLLIDDLAASASKSPFAIIVACLGAALLVAGVIAFVASNWEVMSRLSRLVVLGGGLWLSYALAIVFHRRDQATVSIAFVVLGLAIFGAGIFLVGQMFQLQGSAADAIALWLGAAVVMAVALKSSAVLDVSIVLSVVWLATMADGGEVVLRPDWSSLGLYPVVWLVLVALALWFGRQLSAHLLCLAAIAFAISWVVDGGSASTEVRLFGVIGFCTAAVILFNATIAWRWWRHEGLTIALPYIFAAAVGSVLLVLGLGTGNEAGQPFYPALLYLFLGLISATGIAIAVVHARSGAALLRDQVVAAVAALAVIVAALVRSQFGNDIAADVTMALLAFFFSIWAVRYGWRMDYPLLSACGYAGFAITVLVTYSKLLGTLQMTSIFYVGIGGLLLVGAIIALRRDAGAKGDA